MVAGTYSTRQSFSKAGCNESIIVPTGKNVCLVVRLIIRWKQRSGEGCWIDENEKSPLWSIRDVFERRERGWVALFLPSRLCPPTNNGFDLFFFFTSLLSNCLWGRLLVAASSLSPRQMRPSRKSDETSRPRNKLLPSFRNRAVFSPPPFLASNHGNGSLIVGNNSLREREREKSLPSFLLSFHFLPYFCPMKGREIHIHWHNPIFASKGIPFSIRYLSYEKQAGRGWQGGFSIPQLRFLPRVENWIRDSLWTWFLCPPFLKEEISIICQSVYIPFSCLTQINYIILYFRNVQFQYQNSTKRSVPKLTVITLRRQSSSGFENMGKLGLHNPNRGLPMFD